MMFIIEKNSLIKDINEVSFGLVKIVNKNSFKI